VPQADNFYAALNSAVFTDGSFVYIPEGVRCPMELSTYFRINAENTGQFERTLIIADKGSYVSYLEGCTRRCATRTSFTPPWLSWSRWKMPRSSTRRCRTGTPATKDGKGGIYNFVTKRGDCRGNNSKIVDPGRNRLGDHLEVSVLHPARRQFAWRVLFDRHFQRLPAGR
jgi:Fe-S cluster assembly protein SufB